MPARFGATLAAICLLVVGCNGGSETTVTGSVAFRDKPLADAGIMFFPKSGRPVAAALDAEGKYSVRLEPGDYRVIVNKAEPLPPGWKEGDPAPQSKSALPVEYTEPARTKLTATVDATKFQTLDFDLK